MQAFEPTFYDQHSLALILGSFPSRHSRQYHFYYQHPKNRFWKILESLFKIPLCENLNSKESIDRQKAFLKDKKIVVWDTIISCNAPNSSDSDLREIQINHGVMDLLKSTAIEAIFLNGSKAKESFHQLCKKHQKELLEIEGIEQKKHFELQIQHRVIKVYPLLSTSPANARYSLEALIQNWQIIKQYIP